MQRRTQRRTSWSATAEFLAAGIVAGCLLPAGAIAAATEDAKTATVYGASIGDLEPTPIARILAEPEKWRGREVVVKGEITGVCPMMGCWMELREGAARVRIKVEDGVIVFPADAEGRTAVARGKVELLDMERDEYLEWRRHQAEELGETFDERSVGDGPYRIVQIAGAGAEIAPPGRSDR
jgi:Domain of unknown function (DUF4920)